VKEFVKMNELLTHFTNMELLERYGELYRKYTQPTTLRARKKNEELMLIVKNEILKRMENKK
jgi:hypothetical protein